MQAASRLTNEIVYLFKIGDQDIQVHTEHMAKLTTQGQCKLGSRQHFRRLARTSQDNL
jgi:hypothetical protein